MLVNEDGEVAFDDFSSADATGEQYWFDRDDAALLVLTTQLVGNERAIPAMIGVLGKERAGSVIPVVQPAALPAALTKGVKHQAKELKSLQKQNDLVLAVAFAPDGRLLVIATDNRTVLLYKLAEQEQ